MPDNPTNNSASAEQISGTGKKNAFDIKSIHINTPAGSVLNIDEQWIGLEFYEDVFSENISGTIILSDARNLLEIGPIIGDETIKINLSAPSISGESPKNIEKDFRIYKISDRVLDGNGKLQQYKLHFITNDALTNLYNSVNYSISNKPIDEMISIIYDNHFGPAGSEGDTNSDPTVVPISFANVSTQGKYTYNFPNKDPFSCIRWLTRRAINSNNPADCSYVFYQDFDGYKLDTLVNMIKQPVALNRVYNYKIRNLRSILKPLTFGADISDYLGPQKVHFEKDKDKLTEIKEGLYASSILTYDMTTKSYTAKTYDYFEHFDELYGNEESMKNKAYPIISKRGDHHKRIATVINYYPKSIGNMGTTTGPTGDWQKALDHKESVIPEILHRTDNGNFEDWVLNRESLEQQILSNTIILSGLEGDSTLRVGQTSEFIFPSPKAIEWTSNDFKDKYVSGKYLITSVRHLITRQDYVMNLELMRNFYEESIPDGSHSYRNLESYGNQGPNPHMSPIPPAEYF